MKKKVTVSRLVEDYFKSITQTPNKETPGILEMIEGLEKPAIDVNENLKERYYLDQKNKYGV